MIILVKKYVFRFARSFKQKKGLPNIDINAIGEEERQPSKTQKVSEYEQIKNKVETALKEENNESRMQNIKKFIEENQRIEQILKKQEYQQRKQKKQNKLSDQEKLRRLEVPQNLIKAKTAKSNSSATMQKERATQKHQEYFDIYDHSKNDKKLKDQSKIQDWSNQQYERKVILANQQIMLAEIEKNSQIKAKNIKIRKQEFQNNKQDEGDVQITDEEINLIIRQQKMEKMIQEQINPLNAKIQITNEDIIAKKYSAEIIEKAKDYHIKNLQHFKNLIESQPNKSQQSKISKHRNINKSFSAPSEPITNLPKLQFRDYQLPKNQQKGKQQEGVVAYENTQYYKEKGLKQFRQMQNMRENDFQLKQHSDSDLKVGNKSSEIFLAQGTDKVSRQSKEIQRSEILDQSSYGLQKKRVHDLVHRMKKLGLSFELQDVKTITKASIFEEKQLAEEQLQFQKNLMKREKRKAMKEEIQQMHKQRLREDLDFQKEIEPVATLKEINKTKNALNITEEMEKLKQYQRIKKLALLPQDKDALSSAIHYKKTFGKLQGYLNTYFFMQLDNANSQISEQIEITGIIPNKKNTVINVFWKYRQNYLKQIGVMEGKDGYSSMLKKKIKEMETRLKKQSTYIGGKMTQKLGLRYAPDIRFHLDFHVPQTKKLMKELQKYKKQIAMTAVVKLKEKMKLTEEQQKEYYQKYLAVAENNLTSLNNRRQLLSKSYKAKALKQIWKENIVDFKDQNQEQEDRIKQKGNDQKQMNKNEMEGSNQKLKSKLKKKSKVEQFWNKIDLL